MIRLWAFIPGWILAVVTVVGNGLVIFLIITRRNLRTTTNWFVLSLAVADLGVGALLYPLFSFYSLIRGETFLNDARKIAFVVGVLFLSASVTNLCALTLDRYLAVVHPLRYVTFMTKKRVALLVSAAWGVASTLSASSFLSHVVFRRDDHPIIAMSLHLYQVTITLAVCIFLLFATVRIFLVVRRIARRNAAVIAQLNFNRKLQHGVAFKPRETASAKMIRIVVTVSLTCYLLWVADVLLHAIEVLSSKFVADFNTILMILNSAVNPMAYALYKRELKKELKQLFRCKRK